MRQIASDARHPPTASTLTGRIRRRLLAGLLITSVVAAVSIGGGMLAFSETDRAYSEVLAGVAIAQDHATNLNDAVVAEVLHTRGYLISGDEESITSRNLARQNFEREYADLQNVLEGMPGTTTAVLRRLVALHAEYDALAEDIIGARRSGQVAAAVELFDARSNPLVFELLAARRELQADIEASVLEANREYSQRTGQIISLVAAAFAVGAIASGWFVTRLLAGVLRTLDYFEHAMVETVQAESINPVRLPKAVSDRRIPIIQAYDTLIDRLEESETRRLDFLEIVAHELRSPLGSILGYAEIVEDVAARHTHADLQKSGRVIVTQAQRIGQMVENMMMAAMIDEDRLEVILVPVPLSVLLAEVVEEARRRCGRAITFENDLGSALIEGDALSLRTAFSNLIDNAVKFSAPDTPVHVSARRAASSTWAEVTVADHGLGIAEADLPRLFQRFGRIKNEQTRGIPGSGLGLYIVKYLVRRHRGHVTVSSQPARGTAFVVRLPLGVGGYLSDEGEG